MNVFNLMFFENWLHFLCEYMSTGVSGTHFPLSILMDYFWSLQSIMFVFIYLLIINY